MLPRARLLHIVDIQGIRFVPANAAGFSDCPISTANRLNEYIIANALIDTGLVPICPAVVWNVGAAAKDVSCCVCHPLLIDAADESGL